MNKPPLSTISIVQQGHSPPDSHPTLATGDSLEPDSTRSLVNLPTVISGDSISETTGLPLALAPASTIVSGLCPTGVLATSSTIPLVVPALTLPPHLEITRDWRNYCESLGAGILAEYIACELDPFWMLTIRPPKNWSKEWIGQAIKAAAIAYHGETYGTDAFTNDDFVYYAAILWSQRSKRWHAHLLCQRLPLHPDLLVRCFETAINRNPGTIDLKDHDNLRALASLTPGWLDQIQPDVDYRTYLAGRRNITGHYGWDPEAHHDPHVDLYSPVLKLYPERERLVIVAEPAATVLTATPGHQQPVPGGSAPGYMFGRKLLQGMRLESCAIGDRFGMVALYHIFRDEQGLTYRWNGSNPEPVNARGNRHPGRYRLVPGIALDFKARVQGHWPDGAIRISHPYFRLDAQPEATRREYARKYHIALEDLGLDG